MQTSARGAAVVLSLLAVGSPRAGAALGCEAGVARADGVEARAEETCAFLASGGPLDPAALEACRQALAAVPTRDPGARGVLEQARLALARAAELRAGGRVDAAERALRIARAALLLADRRMALDGALAAHGVAPGGEAP